MSTLCYFLAISSLMLISYFVIAQNPPQGAPQSPPQPMSFFVTSVGLGKGGDLGGLSGADAQCQKLATAVGAGNHTWHAYLSTQGPNAVNARDRIGKGPWYNAKGVIIAQNVDDLHGDIERDRNNIRKNTALNEKGAEVNGIGDNPNTHDMLTGSTSDGKAFTDSVDHTCGNWTSSNAGTAMLGHHDRNGGTTTSWNSAHQSRGCNQEQLVASGGAGLFYCFATN